MKLIFEIVIVALGAIRANALRSVLTSLGIIIGIAAVITMVALGEGAQRNVEAQLDVLGASVLTVIPGDSWMSGISREGSLPLTLSDAEAIRDQAEPGLMLVSPTAESRRQVSWLRYNSNSRIEGGWPEYFEIQNHPISLGRLYTQSEVDGKRRVAVLGSAVPEALGTEAEVILGETIQIGGQPFEVIGVLEPKGSVGPWVRPDEKVFIPITTGVYRVFGGRDRLGGISVKPSSVEDMAQATVELDRVLRREHRIRPGEQADFTVRESSDFLESRSAANQTFTYLLAGIAGVSLLVGGIGIMNIMLVSVTERTREIGTRKALGATRAAILFQFLIEALVLCFIGGALGVAAGYGGAWALASLANWNATVPANAVYVALGFSLLIGLFFGLWPAQRAARLNPIEALRYE